MKNTQDLLDALKAKTGAPSDYALHKTLGVTKQAISRYRTGLDSFSDEMALKVASILEMEPYLVLAICHADRAKTEPEKAAWRAAFEKLGGMAAAVVLGIAMQSPTPAQAAPVLDSSASNFPNSVYYVKSRRRKKQPLGMTILNLLSPPRLA